MFEQLCTAGSECRVDAYRFALDIKLHRFHLTLNLLAPTTVGARINP